ncbi:phospholipid/cholesterol/gamma-HCH transport system ATP-binding protein [Malaciobacter marinus]|jgi:phospholipid/cholesterol/gamma-HCH transport system ATP-binding protein|uniref:Phospholipid/cholesterol/gamma-HCH transport system ATP-binding protein n=1 Tax=Malaciobacter marinus TaxID=505249 RepID=A0AB36ZV13_9BACT|nr:ATP-binding cassette domain-containing protein [Malaciobacter marinus]PPK60371.1 phospholipid/cholesterol/gamma-HCH transport system ATP-binding protein [Malaciobacter marinus]SKB64367.1 phospholipid/cholesterol/gamma-HCH transport system ATP-binding protein [Malaciobacter marinus]
MNIVEVKNLHTSFDTKIIHNNISFNIKKNEIFGILGGSGSGKSVLIKQIVMLQKIQKGEIIFLNENLSNLTLKKEENLKLQFSYLFQFGALYSFLNVIENIKVILKEYTKLPKDLITKIALTNLNMVGLDSNSAYLYPSQLSGGMKKKVALARAIANQPKILFLDEPTSGLDPSSTIEFNHLIKKLRDTLDLTIIIITHDLDTIKSTLDRFIILKDAKIHFNGTLNQALKSEDKFTRSFLTFKKDSYANKN